MASKKFFWRILVIVLVFMMILIGCDLQPRGGTVIFINDLPFDVNTGRNYYTCTVGIAVSYEGTPNAPISMVLDWNKEISASLDEDGYYAVAGAITSSISTTVKVIGRSGRLSGGETITIKASEFR